MIHRELTHAATQSEPLPPALNTPLQPLDDSSDDEQLARTQKSVLRPKIASVSKKLIGKRNRNGDNQQDAEPEGDEADKEDDPDAMSDVETPSKTRGHELIRTPISSARPRTRSILAKSNNGPAASLLKTMLRQKSKAPSNSKPSESNQTPEGGAIIPPLPPIDSNETLESEVWNCRMAGCSKSITSKGDERKKEIESHAGEHDWETQMRVELVETEQRMHSVLPVTNLMQYLITQHYQQMRDAFPEIYPVETDTNQVNGDANGEPEEEEPPSSPSLPAPVVHEVMNGNDT